MTHSFFGYDLGTVSGQVAVLDATGRAQVVKMSDGETSTPTDIYFDENDKPVFGREAESLSLVKPSRGVRFYKRSMGSPQPLITIGGRAYTAEDLAALQLRHIKEYVERDRNTVFDAVVLTVPANHDDARKAALIRAARTAGFREVVLKHEPTAALFARLNDSDKKIADGLYLAVDVGGGTTDFTLLWRQGNEFVIITTKGVNELGGIDFTKALVDHAIAKAGEQGVKISEKDLEDYADLWRQAEESKRRLNRAEQVTIVVIKDGKRIPVTIDKAAARQLWRPLVDQLIACLQQTIAEAKDVKLADILELLLIGGGSECFFVQEELEKSFGRKLSDHGDRINAVALGAARLGLEHWKGAKVENRFLPPKGLVVKDVTGQAIGVSALDEHDQPVFAVVIDKGEPMGSSHKREFALSKDGATSVAIEVLQGQPGTALAACTLLGKFDLNALPAVNGRPHKIELQFVIDENGIVTATARDTESQQTGDLKIAYDRKKAA